jgi:hypothetical protein
VETVIVHRQDDSLLAAFSTKRSAREGVIETAKETKRFSVF